MSDAEVATQPGKPDAPAKPGPVISDTSSTPAETGGLPAGQSGNPAARHDAVGSSSEPKSAPEAVVHEFVDQVINPKNPMGPFSDPHSTMIAGIEEHVGYIPGWTLLLMITAVLLAMIMWLPMSGY